MIIKGENKHAEDSMLSFIRHYWKVLIGVFGVIWWAASIATTVSSMKDTQIEQGRKIDAIYDRLLPDKHSSLEETQESQMKRFHTPSAIAKGD